MYGVRGMAGRRGLGEYPGYYCYDNNRPSWLPYWIDDLTESECKYSPSTIAGNIKACVTGDPSCGAPTPQQANPALPGPGVTGPGYTALPPGTQTNVPVCTGGQVLDPDSNTCIDQAGLSTSTMVALGLVGGVALLVLMGGGRGRR